MNGHDFLMFKKAPKKTLLDGYQFEKFKTSKLAKGKFGDKNALVLSLSRLSKKVYAPNVIVGIEAGMIGRSRRFVIYPAATAAFIWSSISGVFVVGRLGW